MESDPQKVYANDSMYQKFMVVLMEKMPDVHFIFEEEDDVVKIPAHKTILSASSPVFDAMFNGELKEEGDVKIIDASSPAFKEFLQLFYGYQVKLTMDNIAEVLKLIDKYDVAAGFAVCVDFLKDHLVVDDILWGLHLAIKFKLGELKTFCTSKIERHSKEVWDLFEMDDDERLKLSTNPNNRYLSDEDAERIFYHVFKISKNIMSNRTPEIDRLCEKRVHSIGFVTTWRYEVISEFEMLQFTLSKPMLLTDIFCSTVLDFKRSSAIINHSFDVSIEHGGIGNVPRTLYSTKIELTAGDNRVKLTNPIMMDSKYGRYAIVMKSATIWESLYTYGANIPKESVELAPNINISFHNVKESSGYTHSLISHLCFMRTDDN